MRRRGFMLVAVLLFSLILFALGLGLLGGRVSQYRGSYFQQRAAGALALARSGLEDARLKLSKDLQFPIGRNPEQTVFSYSEDVTNIAGNFVGSYTVNIDRTWALPPYEVLVITSIGNVGPPGQEGSRRRLRAELDLAELVRGTTNPNPDYYRLIHLEDLGSL